MELTLFGLDPSATPVPQVEAKFSAHDVDNMKVSIDAELGVERGRLVSNTFLGNAPRMMA